MRSITGSSPLARGLLALLGVLGEVARIIPARAGFTLPDDRDHPSSADHPRSRGVYRRGAPDGGRDAGSSPLARGLPTGQAMRLALRGIIPARAGFTCRSWQPVVCPADHPRSRGVYLASAPAAWSASGSSPLARGLQLQPVFAQLTPRIIPARAGFTAGRPWSSGEGADHPRSRGVYVPPPVHRRPPPGSSPLARGLREASVREWFRERIIPARAGFTRRPETRARTSTDHPRSRGVYRHSVLESSNHAGSSPLARGLHSNGRAGRCNMGIIPARAGFTEKGR